MRQNLAVWMTVALLLLTAWPESAQARHPRRYRPAWHGGRVIHSPVRVVHRPAPRYWRYRPVVRPGYQVVVRPRYRYYTVATMPNPFWLGFPVMVYEEHHVVHRPTAPPPRQPTVNDHPAPSPDWPDEQEYEAYHEDGWEDEEYQDEGIPSPEEVRDNARRSFEDLEQHEAEWDNPAPAWAQPHQGQPQPRPEPAPGWNDQGTHQPEHADRSDTDLDNQGTMEPEPDSARPYEHNLSGKELFHQEMERQIFTLINQERQAQGLAPLHYDEKLSLAARQHSREMNTLGYFDHESPVAEYRTLPLRLEKAGISRYGWAGENIAMSTRASAEQFVRMWMESPGHKANILRPEFQFTGIGVFGSATTFYATQVFSSLR